LAGYLIERFASRAGKKIQHIAKRSLELFQEYDWPGNIRELQNLVERAVFSATVTRYSSMKPGCMSALSLLLNKAFPSNCR